METTALARGVVAEAPAHGPPPPAPERLHVPRPRWLATFTAVLVALDAGAMAAATLTSKFSWLGISPEPLLIRGHSVPYAALVLVTVPTWLVLLGLAGAYDLGPFGSDSGEWTRIVRAGAQLLAVIAVAYYIAHLAMLGRGVLAGTVPFAVVLTLAGRAAAHAVLRAMRRRGRARRTALVMGSQPGLDALVSRLGADRTAGVTIVDVVAIGPDQPRPQAEDVARALAACRAETLIVTSGLAQGRLRDIAWMLQGTGVQLLVTPTPADMAGLRSEIRPIAGLPLLHLDH
jgi:FlaA1/EpsC-like NDP-sugar epimerase